MKDPRAATALVRENRQLVIGGCVISIGYVRSPRCVQQQHQPASLLSTFQVPVPVPVPTAATTVTNPDKPVWWSTFTSASSAAAAAAAASQAQNKHQA